MSFKFYLKLEHQGVYIALNLCSIYNRKIILSEREFPLRSDRLENSKKFPRNNLRLNI